MSEPIAVLGISGSLRKGSFNTALLRAAVALAPEGMRIDLATIRDIPAVYDEDVRAQGLPEPVSKLREAIRAADAILIVTPEVQLLPARRSQETRSRLGLHGRPTSRFSREAARHHGRERRHGRHDARAVRPAAHRGLPRHAPTSNKPEVFVRNGPQGLRRCGRAGGRGDEEDRRAAPRGPAQKWTMVLKNGAKVAEAG